MLQRRAKTIAFATFIAAAVVACGQTFWGGLAYANVKLTPLVPWASPAMVVVLMALYGVLSGRLWPRRGGEQRRALLNLRPVSPAVMTWSIISGALGVTAAAGAWIVLSQLTPWTPNLLPSLTGVPPITLAALLITGSLAAPLSEEAAFRGYAQGLIGRVFNPWTAVVIVSVLFALVHLTQGFYPGKLAVYFAAGLTFGAVAKLARSILASIPVHMLADLTFFILVWPGDAARVPVSQGGADLWFWVHLAQVAVFAPLCVLSLRRLARVVGEPARTAPRCPGAWTGGMITSMLRP